MHWLLTLDTKLFLFGNRSLANPCFDWLMPVLSGGGGMKKALLWSAAVAVVGLLAFGNRRLRVCTVFAILVVASTDGLLCNSLKNAVGRARPFVVLPEARLFGHVGRGYVPPEYDAHGNNLNAGKGSHNSMPSAHAANWFAATMALFLFYRRSAWFMLPLAAGVAFSRIYNGVHYPSDVLAGALLGAGWAVALAVSIEAVWQFFGRKYFPQLLARAPSLVPNLNFGKTGAR